MDIRGIELYVMDVGCMEGFWGVFGGHLGAWDRIG